MHAIRKQLNSLALSSILLSLTACGSAPVRTETVEVKVPVYVALPKELTATKEPPGLPAGPVTVGGLTEGYAELQTWAYAAWDQLKKIAALQLTPPPEK